MLCLILLSLAQVIHCCDWFEQSEKEETMQEVRNEARASPNRKGGKLNEIEQNG